MDARQLSPPARKGEGKHRFPPPFLKHQSHQAKNLCLTELVRRMQTRFVPSKKSLLDGVEKIFARRSSRKKGTMRKGDAETQSTVDS